MIICVCVGDMPYGDIIKRRMQINLDGTVRSMALFIADSRSDENDRRASAGMAWSVNSALS